VTAWLAALRRDRVQRRGANELRRERLGGVALLSATITVERGLWPALARAVAAAVAAAAGRTLGRAEIVTGEPPILASFGVRRDVVASRVVSSLTSGGAHRRPTLWLALNDGVYLAGAVDPDVPLVATPETVAAIVRSGRAARALLTDSMPAGGGVVLRLEVYAWPSDLRRLLRSARGHFAAEAERASVR
jgi:hypothetical protein